MVYPHLRLYDGRDDGYETEFGTATATRNLVSVPLEEILPLLADAYQRRRTWLRDFADDEVTLSQDLYEVLQAYRQVRRPSA